MKKEGKVDLLSVLILSLVILIVYSVFVFGTHAYHVGVDAEFPENFTNASATKGIANSVLPSMRTFNGSIGQFKCNFTTTDSLALNITNVSLFLNTSPILHAGSDAAIDANQTRNSSPSGNGTVIFNTTAINEGTYYWVCVGYNKTQNVTNSTFNRTFIIDRTNPGFTNLGNTSNSVVSTGSLVSVLVNGTDNLTTILGAVLYVNISGTASNEVNTSFTAANAITIRNSTQMNISFRIPGSALDSVLNFTVKINDSVSNSVLTDALIFTVEQDGTPPGIVIGGPVPLHNQTSTNVSFNFTASDNNGTGTLTCGINITLGSTIFFNSSIVNIKATNNTAQINTTERSDGTLIASAALSNGTYIWNVSCTDPAGNLNTSLSRNFTIDTIPPVLAYLNVTNSSTYNFTGGHDVNAVYGLGTGGGVATAQNYTIYFAANWSDNLTAPRMGILQFYNYSAAEWHNLSVVNVTPQDDTGFSNFSFYIPRGHNNFEGDNITFRIIANDTLGNINNSASVRNITVQINDSTAPTLEVTLNITGRPTNNSNISDTTPTIIWNVTDGSSLNYISIQVDSSTDSNCNLFKNYTTSAQANANRNGSITVKGPDDEAGCAVLGNGTHTVKLSTTDEGGNGELYIHSFNIETSVPSISLYAIDNNHTGIGTAFPAGLSVVNKTNITPYTGLNFSATDGATGKMLNFSWVSSCNGSVQVLASGSSTNNFTDVNASVIYPFNSTICDGVEANQSVNITVADVAGNVITGVFQFAVDGLGPAITVNSPVDTYTYTMGLTDINVSVIDSMNQVATVGYFLDGEYTTVRNHTINGTTITPAQGQNSTLLNLTINLTAGRHTIKITANDTLGNRRNSSEITFFQYGPINAQAVNESIVAYLGKINPGMQFNTTIKAREESTHIYNVINTTYDLNGSNTFEILIRTNTSSTNEKINVTLADINGTGVNWDMANFSLFINETNIIDNINTNWTTTVLMLVYFNKSIDDFIPNENHYYGKVNLPGNITTNGLYKEIWWFPSDRDLSSKTNVSACTSGFTATTSTACFNYTAGGNTIVNVPHFSIVVAVNDTTAPTIHTVNMPSSDDLGNTTRGMFEPNITVSADTTSCVYTVNTTSASTDANVTMNIHVDISNVTYCLGPTQRFKNTNISLGAVHNLTFYALDAANNIAKLVFSLNVSDKTAPGTVGSVSSSVSSSTAATVTVSGNESVNLTVHYGTTNTSLTSNAVQTDFNKTQTATLSGLSASTTYYYNVSICDFNGNCQQNATYLFTTSAASSSSSSTTISDGGGGGGGGGTVSKEQASASKVWGDVPAGSSISLDIDKSDIAISKVEVTLNTKTTNAEIKVASLKDNPVKERAAAKVYQYLQITKKNINNEYADKIVLSFRVPKTWLSDNGMSSTDVALYRYEEKWSKYAPKVIGTDNTHVNYEVEVPGFSYFAIGSKTAGSEELQAILDMIDSFYATGKPSLIEILDAIDAYYAGGSS